MPQPQQQVASPHVAAPAPAESGPLVAAAFWQLQALLRARHLVDLGLTRHLLNRSKQKASGAQVRFKRLDRAILFTFLTRGYTLVAHARAPL